MGLKIESSIQSQPIVPRAIGAVQGSMIRKRASHLPWKSFIRAVASRRDRRMTRVWETRAKRKVFFRESRKTGSARAA